MSHETFPTDADASGRSFDAAELQYVREVLDSGRLFGPSGSMTSRLEKAIGSTFAVPYVRAVASGTAAVHSALGALDLEPGCEVVSSPITDMGAILPILAVGAVPIFADVDPDSLNVTPESIERCLTPRTRAIIVTHLFGQPCDMQPIMSLARDRGVAVIEDCAQAFLAADQGRLVGTIGDFGCFSLQQGKHATCGEGGFVLCSDEALARRVRLFGDKAWPFGQPDADHEFLSTNYRMSELQAAVALAQIEKLSANVEARCASIAHLASLLADGPPGIRFPVARPGTRHTYWRIALMVDPDLIPAGPEAIGASLSRDGLRAAPRYIKKPAFECRIFREQRTFGRSRWPFSTWEQSVGRKWNVDRGDFPGTCSGLSRVVAIGWNERMTTAHAARAADAIRRAVAEAGESTRASANRT